MVGEAEWQILSEPQPERERESILQEHVEVPFEKWRQKPFVASDDPLLEGFASVHDVTGDGSMLLLPTLGHIKRSMSLSIRQKSWWPILLVGDLTYETALLENDQFPGTDDKETLLASFAKVRRLKERLPDMDIVASHDFAAQEAIARATGDTLERSE